jgi:hypothetical protein
MQKFEAFLIAIDPDNKTLHVGLFEEGEVNCHSDVLTKKPIFSGFVTESSWRAVLTDREQKDFEFRK